VKPDNMLVNASGDLKWIDFAISKRIQKGFLAKLFHKRRPAGTRSYMSPEQVRGELLDARTDVYSFGATVYELVTGRPPFRGASTSELLTKQLNAKPDSPQVYNPDVSDEFATLVLRMLAKKREDRPKNFHEILMALRGMRIFKSQTLPTADPGM
jgi:serine/threonine protein kinase